MNIIEVISTQRKGKLLVQAQEALQEVVKACTATGKKGVVILKLEISAAEDSTVVLRDDVSTKLPKPSTGTTMFYADEHGALHREDPRQPELPTIANAVAA